jgi:hypothetical protein
MAMEKENFIDIQNRSNFIPNIAQCLNMKSLRKLEEIEKYKLGLYSRERT